jgi:hypothetical protein
MSKVTIKPPCKSAKVFFTGTYGDGRRQTRHPNTSPRAHACAIIRIHKYLTDRFISGRINSHRGIWFPISIAEFKTRSFTFASTLAQFGAGKGMKSFIHSVAVHSPASFPAQFASVLETRAQSARWRASAESPDFGLWTLAFGLSAAFSPREHGLTDPVFLTYFPRLAGWRNQSHVPTFFSD